jgi:hypothetical protein
MGNKIRLSQEEEIIEFLLKEGFEEVSSEQIKEEPFKSIYQLPECFDTERDG